MAPTNPTRYQKLEGTYLHDKGHNEIGAQHNDDVDPPQDRSAEQLVGDHSGQCITREGTKLRLHTNLLCVCARACVCSVVPTLCHPTDVACQASLSLGFFRQEYWRGLPFPPLGDLPHPGIESESLASADGFFPTELLEKFC